MRSRNLFFAVAILGANFSGSAWAAPDFCIPDFGPTRFVGDKASDSKCTDNDIQSAIDATANNGSACPAKIFITREHTYSNQALTISNTGKTITLIGQDDGVLCGTTDNSICIGDTCPPPPVNPLVTISGRAGSSVLHIDGTNTITLRYLTLTQGSVGNDQLGGGIYFNGSGSLTLETSTVSFNTAGFGGGIDFLTSDGAKLTLGANTLIFGNTATNSGGGIRVEGNARMFASQPRTLILQNHAPNGRGGGLEVVAFARADIGSPGYNSGAVIQGNDALYGGGISVDTDNDGENATVRLFTVDPAQPVQVSNNRASNTGGGIYVHVVALGLGPFFNSSNSTFCASDFRFDDNVAQEGTAIYADVGSGPAVRLNSAVQCGPETIESLGAMHCGSGVTCNTIHGNIAEDASNNPTAGSTLLSQSDDFLEANNVDLRSNTGAYGIRELGVDNGEPFPSSRLYVGNCLIVDNAYTGSAIRSEDATSEQKVDGCTFANNNSLTGSVVYSTSPLTFTDSLIVQGNRTAFAGSPSSISRYILAENLGGLASESTNTVLTGDPLFVDAAAGNYHLQRTSPAVDYAGGIGGLDAEGHQRDVDLTQKSNLFGPRDLGPYEVQLTCAAGDTIFCDGFEIPN
jgi:predicted outer membrane repeat protein